MNNLKIYALLTAVLVIVVSQAQTKDDNAIKYSETITAEELNEHLSILASDDYEGRETGEKGEQMAADYLVKQFISDGILPVNGDSYFQEFPLEKYRSEGEANVYGKTYTYLNDFVFFRASGLEFQLDELLYCGYGIQSEKYNDYAGIDVKGKDVIISSGEPVDKDGISYLTGDPVKINIQKDLFKKMNVAGKNGVKHLFIVYDDFENMFGPYKHFFTGMKMRLKNSKEPDNQGTRVFMISKTMADEIFTKSKKSLDKLEQKINKKGKPVSYQFPTSVFMNTKSKMIDTFGKNVIAYIEGSDLKNELVVITAHYDHLGTHDGKVYNGADDDGSGTVGLIEIAEAFSLAKAEGFGPRRSILIMPVSGEEKGLLGSEYYSENPVFPLEKTITNLNIDMIGRVDEAHTDNPDYVYLIGSDRLSMDLHNLSEWINTTYVGLDLDYTYNAPDDPNNFYQRSDHYNFAKNNIPVIFYFNGTHEDYHQSTDTIEKIDFKRLETRTKLVFFTAWHLVNQDERPELDVVQ